MSTRPRIEIRQTQRLALNANLQTSIEILRADAASLTRYLEDQAADNPLLNVVHVAPSIGEWLPRWQGFIGQSSAHSSDGMADIANPAPGLIAHVMAGIKALDLGPQDRRIALSLTEALEPSGWLGRSLPQVATDCAATVAEVQTVLTRLQTIDPPGIFARNLAECLTLQLQDLGQLDPPMRLLLANLPLLASGDTERLAKLCHTDADGILARFRRIRTLNPKPGAEFGTGSAPPTREPDLLAEPTETGGWRISLNRSALPSVEVSGTEKGAPGHRSHARALQNLVAARNATLLAVGTEIAARQSAALANGPAALTPLRMADIAETLNLHESTISRVVAGASLDTPRGTWWLRKMFTTRITGLDGHGHSAAALRAVLAELVRQEDPQSPYSDQALAEALSLHSGVNLARRTVAKYREAEGIPPTPRRRQR